MITADNLHFLNWLMKSHFQEGVIKRSLTLFVSFTNDLENYEQIFLEFLLTFEAV